MGETGLLHGLYWLLCALAESGPLALLIDDAQVITATGAGDELAALWSSHPNVVELARRALRSPPAPHVPA